MRVAARLVSCGFMVVSYLATHVRFRIAPDNPGPNLTRRPRAGGLSGGVRPVWCARARRTFRHPQPSSTCRLRTVRAPARPPHPPGSSQPRARRHFLQMTRGHRQRVRIIADSKPTPAHARCSTDRAAGQRVAAADTRHFGRRLGRTSSSSTHMYMSLRASVGVNSQQAGIRMCACVPALLQTGLSINTITRAGAPAPSRPPRRSARTCSARRACRAAAPCRWQLHRLGRAVVEVDHEAVLDARPRAVLDDRAQVPLDSSASPHSALAGRPASRPSAARRLGRRQGSPPPPPRLPLGHRRPRLAGRLAAARAAAARSAPPAAPP